MISENDLVLWGEGLLSKFLKCRMSGDKKGECVNFLFCLIDGLCDPKNSVNLVVKKTGVSSGVFGLYMYHSLLNYQRDIQKELFDYLQKNYPEWRWPTRGLTQGDIERIIANLIYQDLVSAGILRQSRYKKCNIQDINSFKMVSVGGNKHNRGRAAVLRPEAPACIVHPLEDASKNPRGVSKYTSEDICKKCWNRIKASINRVPSETTDADKELRSIVKGDEWAVITWLKEQAVAHGDTDVSLEEYTVRLSA